MSLSIFLVLHGLLILSHYRHFTTPRVENKFLFRTGSKDTKTPELHDSYTCIPLMATTCFLRVQYLFNGTIILLWNLQHKQYCPIMRFSVVFQKHAWSPISKWMTPTSQSFLVGQKSCSVTNSHIAKWMTPMCCLFSVDKKKEWLRSKTMYFN